MTGDFEAARTLMARHRAIMEEIGRKLMLGGSAQMAGYVEMLAGDAPAAERELRRGYAILDSAGDRAYLPAVAAMLASALEAQGRHAEAERYVETASSMAADGDIDTQFRLRVIRAQLLLAQGRADEAERLVRGAVALAADTDELDLQAEGQVVLAEALRTVGRLDEAAAALDEALRHYEEKGNLVSAGRVRATLAEWGGVRARENPRERDEDHFRGSVEPYSFPASAAYASGARLLNLGSRKMRAA
jgi:tetratricopeptide (TPR) repeat protein